MAPPKFTETHATAADNAFRKATAQCACVATHFRIGDDVIRVRLAGEPLAAALTPAMAHLACDETQFDSATGLSIDVWASAEVPVRLPPDEWLTAVSPLAAFQTPDFIYLQPDIGMLVLFRGRQAWVCFRDASAIPTWERTMPLRVVLNAWVQRSGQQIVHGAAIANERHAVLLAGRGGSGKSSTALSCLASPSLSWLGDDLCLLQSGAQVHVCSLYNSLKLWQENLPRFHDVELPLSADSLQLPQKPTFFLFPQYRQKLAHRRPLSAVLLPRITGGSHTRIVAATAADAWRALVPSTVNVIIGNQQAIAAGVTRLVERLPIYWLELGVERAEIAAAIEQFLRHPARQAA